MIRGGRFAGVMPLSCFPEKKPNHMRTHAVKGGSLQRKAAPAKGATGNDTEAGKKSERDSHVDGRSGDLTSASEASLQFMSEGSAAALQLKELSDLAASSDPLSSIAALQGGPTVDAPLQRAAMEEEPAQGRFKSGVEAVQLAAMEEELPVQGKFTDSGKGTLQRAGVEEEEPAQGRFKSGVEAVQRAAMEEELPMQGKFTDSGKGTLQRAGVEEEEPAQGRFKAGADAIQRAAMDEEEPMQGRFGSSQSTAQRKSGAGGDGKLPDSLKSGVESLSGRSMDDVKVHYNSPEPRQMEAHAFAQGSDIHVASGQEKHLPHEAWHVAQQKQGRVEPTTSVGGGVPVNDDPGLEKEADVMGAKALAKGVETAQKKDLEKP